MHIGKGEELAHIHSEEEQICIFRCSYACAYEIYIIGTVRKKLDLCLFGQLVFVFSCPSSKV